MFCLSKNNTTAALQVGNAAVLGLPPTIACTGRFNRVYIRRFSWSFPPINVRICIELLSDTGGMFWVIILHESVGGCGGWGEVFLDEW